MKTKNALPNLIIATDNFLPRRDGITRFLSKTIPHLKNYFNITVICPQFDKKDVPLEGINFVKIPLRKTQIGDFIPAKFEVKKIKKALSKEAIFFSQTLGPIGGTALYLAERKKMKTSAFIHSIEWKLVSQNMKNFFFKKWSIPFVKILVRFLYKRCDYLLVPSDRIADTLSWERILTPKVNIRLGVDYDHFLPYYKNTNRKRIREMLEIDEKDIVLGYHGRLSYEKDLETLLRAFIKIRTKYPQLKLLIVGSGVNSIEKKLKNQKGVIHIPSTSNVYNYLSIMDIYCMPSLTETTSLSTLEAMSTELPIITTGVGFIKDYVKDDFNGYLFKKRDSYDLAKQIEKLLKHSELRQIFGKRSRDIVIKNFDWSTTISHLIAFLQELEKMRFEEKNKNNKNEKENNKNS